MDPERIRRALDRIDAAAGRIASRAAIAPASQDGGDPQLAEKYRNLQTEAGAALADLDRLIAELER